MKSIAKPIRSTIVWGLFSGLFYLLLSVPANAIIAWPMGDQLLLWALLTGYGILLSRWACRPRSSVAWPSILLLIAALLTQSTAAFIWVALGVLSWMRSGICFNRTPVLKRYAVEIGLGVGTGLAVSAVVPAAMVSVALGIWLLFLIQALYFVVFEYRKDPTERVEVDPFDRAKMAAEQILNSWQS
ncbi:MAG: hypothetical protein PVJ35_08655 [Desulfobacterales bacterium]|nr:hypothetical protein [Deltaproteobacteria bacterium]